MLVSTPHSSRNTSRSGAIPATPAAASVGQAARAAAMAARSYYAAGRLRFFHVQPHRRGARPTVQGCTRTPVRAASRSRHSASVRWFASANRPSKAASTSPAILGFGPPPIRLAARRPSVRASRAQRSSGRPRNAAPPPRARRPPPPPPAPARAGPSSTIRPSTPPTLHVGAGIPTFSRLALDQPVALDRAVGLGPSLARGRHVRLGRDGDALPVGAVEPAVVGTTKGAALDPSQ